MPRNLVWRKGHGQYLVVLVLGCAALSSCAGEQRPKKLDGLCSRAICGCWRNHTIQAQVKIADERSQPVSDVTIICESTKKKLGVSDQDGSADIRVKGRTSPGCGYIAKCEVATLHNSAGDILGSVKLTPLLRGEATESGDLRLWIDRSTLR